MGVKILIILIIFFFSSVLNGLGATSNMNSIISGNSTVGKCEIESLGKSKVKHIMTHLQAPPPNYAHIHPPNTYVFIF